MVSSTPRPHFIPGKDPVPILQEAGWAPGPVWTGGKSRPHRDSIPDRPLLFLYLTKNYHTNARYYTTRYISGCSSRSSDGRRLNNKHWNRPNIVPAFKQQEKRNKNSFRETQSRRRISFTLLCCGTVKRFE